MNKVEFNITPVSSEIWSGRVDSIIDETQFRLHQVVVKNPEFDKIKKDHVAMVGFGSDEGVRRNKGRTGAAEGPDYFRKSIGSLCYHGEKDSFYDLGNIHVEERDLESAQKRLSGVIQELLTQNLRPFVIGGGHETAFGHVDGILNYLKKTQSDFKLGILNIDAHLDMRNYEQGAHSGSWALQAFDVAEKMEVDLGYHAYGLNLDNNTKHLLDTARKHGAKWSTNEEVINIDQKFFTHIEQFIAQHTHVYCTVCLDVFDATVAPGVSAPAWNGIGLQAALNLLELAKKSGKLISLDICELNPSFDRDGLTARIAGSLFNTYLRASTS